MCVGVCVGVRVRGDRESNKYFKHLHNRIPYDVATLRSFLIFLASRILRHALLTCRRFKPLVLYVVVSVGGAGMSDR